MRRRDHAGIAINIGLTAPGEDGNPVRQHLGHDQPVVRVDCDAGGRRELLDSALAAQDVKEPARLVENLDQVHVAVGHVNAAPPVEGHPLRPEELAGENAPLAHVRQKPPPPVENLHPRVQDVDNVDPALPGDGHRRGVPELAPARSFAPHSRTGFPSGVKTITLWLLLPDT